MFEMPAGILGRGWESRPQEPWLVDLDTGVVYGHGWQYAKLSTTILTPWQPVKLDLALRSDLRDVWRVTAVVDACRVVWLSLGSTHFPQTTLVLRAG
jgi:hypothetical protein